MTASAQQTIWFAAEMMADRPHLPRIMALASVELRELMERELSDQQRRVILLLSEGYANKHIAWVLGIEEATAKAHVSSILKKFGCTNRTQAALLGLRVRLHALGTSAAEDCCASTGIASSTDNVRHRMS